MSHDYEKDLEIIEAADSPPAHEEWCLSQRPYTIDCNCRDVGWIHPSEVFRTHFNPSYTKQLVEKAMERDALAKRVDALKDRLEYWITMYYEDFDRCDELDDAIEMEELLK